MIEAMVDAQVIMDRQTINERYTDLVVAVATETGWTIDYVLDLPPWTVNQIVDSKDRLTKNAERDATLNNSIKGDKLLGA